MQSSVPKVRIQFILPAILAIVCSIATPLVAQTSLPPTGVVVAKTISMSGSATVDSFDSSDPLKSTNGLYDPAKRQMQGNIFVLDNIGSDLRNAYVYGVLTYSGPEIKNLTHVLGGWAMPCDAQIAVVNDPTWPDGSFMQYAGGGNPPGNGVFVAEGTATNPTQIKVLGDFTVSGGKSLSIITDGQSDRYLTIWVTGKFTTSGSGRLIQDPRAHVTWVIDKDITTSSDNYTNPGVTAGKVSLLAVGPGKVNITGGSGLVATVAAPLRDVSVSGDGGLSGNVICNKLTLSGGSAVHYDEALTFSGPVRISCEGQPPETSYRIERYVESDVEFTSVPNLTHTGPGVSGRPNNGTAYLDCGWKMAIVDVRGRLLKLKAIDLAEYSYVYAYPTSIAFVGSKANGATVSQTLTIDGQLGVAGISDFQTFVFGDEWNDLLRVDAQAAFPVSVDNIVLER